ncbi:MAG: hypothetical protein JXB39_15200 [Deltaproteobacteria bacterium]|nr:hypothetical protein [Deltaproteobacteria bacterium]
MKIVYVTLLGLLVACAPDLPAGWEDAEGIEDFTQDECGGSPYDTGWESTVEANADNPGLRVVGDDLHFRCEQDVEGFYRVDGTAVDVLVQPVDMNPGLVAGCDCLYRVEASIPEEPPATVTLYRRWDNLNDENDPVLVGSVEVP